MTDKNFWFEKTLSSSTTEIEGVGVHSGERCSVIVHPAPEGNGIVFVSKKNRVEVLVPATLQYVIDTAYATSLGVKEIKIGTVEHLLAALHGAQIDNAFVEIRGSEVPILDGSSAPFYDAIMDAGMTVQDCWKECILMTETVKIVQGDRYALLEPLSSLISYGKKIAVGTVLSCSVYFDHPRVGLQRLEVAFKKNLFRKEIASARTFGFLRDVPLLQSQGLSLGGSLENAIVLDENRILNPEGLRYPDEFVRHKILDSYGDLYLLGKTILGRFESCRGGHNLHFRLLKKAVAKNAFVKVTYPALQKLQNTPMSSERVAAFAQF